MNEIFFVHISSNNKFDTGITKFCFVPHFPISLFHINTIKWKYSLFTILNTPNAMNFLWNGESNEKSQENEKINLKIYCEVKLL